MGGGIIEKVCQKTDSAEFSAHGGCWGGHLRQGGAEEGWGSWAWEQVPQSRPALWGALGLKRTA